MRLERVGVIETLDRGDLPSDHAVEVGSNQRRAAFIKGVAHFAQGSVSLALLRVCRSEQLVDFRAASRSLSGRLLLPTRGWSACGRSLRQRRRVVGLGAQEDEHVGALLGVGQTGEQRHLGSGHERARIGDHVVDFLVVPVAELFGLGFQRFGIFVALMRSDGTPQHAVEIGPDHVGAAFVEAVADRAFLGNFSAVLGLGTCK